MSNNNNRQLGEAPWLHVIISTGLGTGFVPMAPGTAGALFCFISNGLVCRYGVVDNKLIVDRCMDKQRDGEVLGR